MLVVTKAQKELLELLVTNKPDFDLWSKKIGNPKVKFQFFYPTAVDFYYEEFKLFTAYFKKDVKGELSLHELKMSETNYDTIRCASWTPFEDVIIEFLTSLEENKKIALFEQRKVLFEYQSLCSKSNDASATEKNYSKATNSALPFLKPSH